MLVQCQPPTYGKCTPAWEKLSQKRRRSSRGDTVANKHKVKVHILRLFIGLEKENGNTLFGGLHKSDICHDHDMTHVMNLKES